MKMRDNLEFLDILNILSFCIGVMNYGENLTQGDKQELMQQFDTKASAMLEEIHSHLTAQDKRLEDIENDIRRNLFKDNSTPD